MASLAAALKAPTEASATSKLCRGWGNRLSLEFGALGSLLGPWQVHGKGRSEAVPRESLKMAADDLRTHHGLSPGATGCLAEGYAMWRCSECTKARLGTAKRAP